MRAIREREPGALVWRPGGVPSPRRPGNEVTQGIASRPTVLRGAAATVSRAGGASAATRRRSVADSVRPVGAPEAGRQCVRRLQPPLRRLVDRKAPHLTGRPLFAIRHGNLVRSGGATAGGDRRRVQARGHRGVTPHLTVSRATSRIPVSQAGSLLRRRRPKRPRHNELAPHAVAGKREADHL